MLNAGSQHHTVSVFSSLPAAADSVDPAAESPDVPVEPELSELPQATIETAIADTSISDTIFFFIVFSSQCVYLQ